MYWHYIVVNEYRAKNVLYSQNLSYIQIVKCYDMNLNLHSAFTLSPPWVLFSLFQLKAGSAFWAFKTMGRASRQLPVSERMPFGLMLGTGGGRGFLLPNWHQYALLTCWQHAEDARNFHNISPLAQALRQRSQEVWTILMQPVASKGLWSGNNPFTPHAEPLQRKEPVVVLTRATIRPSKIVDFLRHVPKVSRATDHAPGLLIKTGIGELPIVQQATFSLWKDQQSVDDFAYHMQEHKQVIARTRQRDWYSEEMFARFRPVQTWGTLEGKNPLSGLLNLNAVS